VIEGNVMRKTWLVIPVVLLSVAPLAAQQPPSGGAVRPISFWAVAQTGEHPGPAYVLLPSNPAAPPANEVRPQPANGGHAPAAVLAVPVAAQPAPQHGCAGGHCGERQPCDWEHFRAWLCYHSLRGCCHCRGSCGCSCSVPLYAYFWGECAEGRKYDLPPCAYEHQGPHLFQHMCQDLRAACGGGH
jgi:hypothetical protein